MLSHWLTQLSDRNPQLLREIKGRVTRRQVLVTLALSLVTQLLIMGYNWRRLGSAYAETSESNMMWRLWWFDICNTTTWIALLLLLFLGSYLLVNDIAQEERRGTLDFVRLSPESAQSVLLGKLLGVPILLYGAIASALPLHLWAANNAGLSLLLIASVYLLAVASCSFVFSFTLLHSLGWGAQAQFWYVLPVPCIIYFLLSLLSVYGSFKYQYHAHSQFMAATGYFNLGSGFFIAVSVLVTAMVVLTFSMWWESIKRFHHPPLRR
ncbi:hypothetical protein H6F86_01890 [Phormidium sp. FACHB-592]|uniref:ABC transporter permease n=1 Tax=Stenomitos frigidus AS-A4 TaxID=2933935 RepID=A0ABV0KM20_9CYAN|nr:hypothetical protein [Phormidium sp. FACHB-592]MBD2072657.1 hypothetical protein [Phormidium sp. FACHB-592]